MSGLMLTVSGVADLVGQRTGRRPTTVTVWRWMRQGCYGVKLRAEKIGGWLFTTPADVEAFLGELAARP